MKKAILICLIFLTGNAAAAADDEAIRAAREEVERARQELRVATSELRRLIGEPRAPVIHREVFRREARPMIGVVMGSARDETGVRLTAVTPGGPAEKAGLEAGDVILSIDGVALSGSDAVSRAYDLLADMKEGDRFALQVRDPEGQTRSLTVEAEMHTPNIVIDVESIAPTIAPAAPMAMRLEDLRVDLEQLGERLPAVRALRFGDGDSMQVWNFGWQWSGLELARLNPELGRYFGIEEGALVLSAKGLDDEDLIPGDVIVSVAGVPVTTPREVMRELRGDRAGDLVAMEVVRDGRTIEIEVTTPDGSPHEFFFGQGYRYEVDDKD